MTHSIFRTGRALLVSDDLPRACVVTAGLSDLTLVEPADVATGSPGEAPFTAAVLMAGVPVAEVMPLVRARCTPAALILVEDSDDGALADVDLPVVDRTELGGVRFAVLSAGSNPSEAPAAEPVAAPAEPASELAHGASDARPEPVAEPVNEPVDQQTGAPTDAARPPKKRPAKKGPAKKRTATPTARSGAGPTRAGSQSLLAGAALVLAVVVAAALARLTGTGYVGGVLTLLLLGVAAGLGLILRQQRRAGRRIGQLERVVVATITEQHRAGETSVGQRVDGGLAQVRTATKALTTRIDTQSTLLAELERQLSVVSAVSLDTSRRLGPPPGSEPFTDPATLAELHQVQALVNLFSLAPARGVIPPMGGWAASPDVVTVLVEDLLTRRPGLIVECGSGVSTLWLSLVIAQYDLPTRIVSLDHDPHYAEQTRQTLRQHGVADAVEVREAPLVDSTLPGHATRWYDPATTTDLTDIGLLFVDGPPDTTGPLVRLPAAPVLKDRLAARCTIVLDDVVRASEQEVTARWQVLLPDFTMERLPLQKVAARFRRG